MRVAGVTYAASDAANVLLQYLDLRMWEALQVRVSQ